MKNDSAHFSHIGSTQGSHDLLDFLCRDRKGARESWEGGLDRAQRRQKFCFLLRIGRPEPIPQVRAKSLMLVRGTLELRRQKGNSFRLSLSPPELFLLSRGKSLVLVRLPHKPRAMGHGELWFRFKSHDSRKGWSGGPQTFKLSDSIVH